MNAVDRFRSPLLAWAAIVYFAALPAAGFAGPLAPVDTSSPQATFESFTAAMGDIGKVLARPDDRGSSRVLKSIAEAVDRAAQCLDLSRISLEREDDVTEVVAVQLQEILDRIELPAMDTIPNAEAEVLGRITRWTIPDTEIVINLIEEGPRAGSWLFSADTVERMEEFYHRIRHLPYRADALLGALGPLGGAYEYLNRLPEPGSVIPPSLVYRFPQWTTRLQWDQPLWKWLGTGIVFGCGVLAFVLIYYWSNRWARRLTRKRLSHYLFRLLPPLSGVVITLLVDHWVDEEIGLGGYSVTVVETSMWSLALLFLAWAVIALGNVVAELINGSDRIDPEGVDASLVRIVTRVVSAALGLWILVAGAERFGISVVPLLAGLGVGGLAVALAIRPTLENVIGGFILFADRPVRVGDLCRFGEQSGVIEEVGLRSTRVRTRQDTILTIPNAEFSQLRLENLSRRRKTQLRMTLGLRYETTGEQLRHLLAKLRQVMLAHPMVAAEDFRVRFLRFGDYSLDIDINAYIRTRDLQQYLAICEDLNLRIIDVVKQSGAEFAFPSQTTYLARDRPPDAAVVRAAEAEVAQWRADGNLPFPEFGSEQQRVFEDTLDYPPEGSPDRAYAGVDERHPETISERGVPRQT